MAGKRTALTAARTAKGLTVGQLAAAVGISRWCLYKVEEGSRNPSWALMRALSAKLGQSVDVLFFDQSLDARASQEVSAP